MELPAADFVPEFVSEPHFFELINAWIYLPLRRINRGISLMQELTNEHPSAVLPPTTTKWGISELMPHEVDSRLPYSDSPVRTPWGEACVLGHRRAGAGPQCWGEKKNANCVYSLKSYVAS